MDEQSNTGYVSKRNQNICDCANHIMVCFDGRHLFFSDDSIALKIGLTMADTMLFGGGIAMFKLKQRPEKYHKIILLVVILGLISTNLLPKIIH